MAAPLPAPAVQNAATGLNNVLARYGVGRSSHDFTRLPPLPAPLPNRQQIHQIGQLVLWQAVAPPRPKAYSAKLPQL